MTVIPRQVEGFIQRLETTLREDAAVTADQLPVGSVVRVAGEWAGVVGFDGRHLRLVRDDSACEWTYEVSDGETFEFDPGAF